MKRIGILLSAVWVFFALQAPGCVMILIIGVSPSSGPQGTTFELSGSGFTPNSGVELHVQKPDGSEYTPLQATTDETGAYVESWTSPTNAPVGQYAYWSIDEATGAQSGTVFFTITERPASNITLSQNQGFDKCEIATTSQLQTWWNASPYRDVNIYIGGSARACANSGLNASWVNAARAQGWNFIPTWVGPQAPCSGYRSRFSSDPTTAFNQGRAEADAAHQRMRELGLADGSTLVYYDMEAYDTTNSACKAATEAALSGWVSRLHELGDRAGIYGSGCGSAPSGWASMQHVPDDVWLAHWIYGSYNPNATVWNVACVSDSLWSNHQRIRQYAGGHNETWGGVTLNIDCNIADGHVVTKSVNVAKERAPIAVTPMEPQRLVFLDEAVGWLRRGNEIFRTSDGGESWRRIMPPLPSDATIFGVDFVDSWNGWIVASDPVSAWEDLTLTLHLTRDGGETWDAIPFELPEGSIEGAIGAVHLDFLDADRGWLVVEEATSSNFSRGALFYTEDGGHIWEARSIPIGAPVSFLDHRTGWTAGGAAGDELYVTRDGGYTWTRHDPAPSRPGTRRFYTLPHFRNGAEGFLAVTRTEGEESTIEVYETTDGGRTWRDSTEIPLASPAAGPIPLRKTGEGMWVVPTLGAVERIGFDEGRKVIHRHPVYLASSLPGVPPAVEALEFLEGGIGWMKTVSGTCSGDKGNPEASFSCENEVRFWKTEDGGRSWRTIAVP